MKVEPGWITDISLSFKEPLIALKDVMYIIVHHTEEIGWDINKTHSFHQDYRGWSGIGYNFFIEENGEIIKGRGYHVGAHAYSYNDKSIGICLAGNFDILTPSIEQLKSLSNLCIFLLNQFNITTTHILGHGELEGITKSCPGKNFDMVQFRESIKIQCIKENGN
ncbi:N-acetylmuramoyl-L-alanine amidase [Neobacillus niacini]|uniref:peptidoglycan recognition protein family protein n=1 Tax=Neobacillus niacini TaxID=86668 RepID=UPI0028642140|nr:peptidoglycan recognition family protein [Neobacillus niacini]MDR7077337.1 N-acetylmuramoyl-L-alanine amidase [Neobacillus niacini]